VRLSPALRRPQSRSASQKIRIERLDGMVPLDLRSTCCRDLKIDPSLVTPGDLDEATTRQRARSPFIGDGDVNAIDIGSEPQQAEHEAREVLRFACHGRAEQRVADELRR
jgi:hypothetical protein